MPGRYFIIIAIGSDGRGGFCFFVGTIYLVVLFDQRTDGVGLARGVGGNQLGDDINAVVTALIGGKCINFRKPLLGGLIIPLCDTYARGGQGVAGDDGKADRVGVAEDAVGWPRTRIGPSRVSADEREVAGGEEGVLGAKAHNPLGKGLGHTSGYGGTEGSCGNLSRIFGKGDTPCKSAENRGGGGVKVNFPSAQAVRTASRIGAVGKTKEIE